MATFEFSRMIMRLCKQNHFAHCVAVTSANCVTLPNFAKGLLLCSSRLTTTAMASFSISPRAPRHLPLLLVWTAMLLAHAVSCANAFRLQLSAMDPTAFLATTSGSC